jgi:acetyl-CoA synthase
MANAVAEIPVKTVAGLMVSGSEKIVSAADGYMAKAIKEKGATQALAFPETAFYLPLANALLGIEAKTLEDGKKILATARTLLPKVPSEDKWNTFLKDALNAGVATILSVEVLLALKYLYGEEPQKDCPGFFSDTLLRALGIQLVDGRISGIAVILGKAPDAKTAVGIVRDLQKRNILTLVGDSAEGVSIIDQLKEGGLAMGLESYVVPFGRDTASVVYVLNFAIRAALTFGGIKAGNTAACVDYVRNRVPAFVLLLGGVDEIKAAAGAGALAAGVPIITDIEAIPEVRVPGVCAHEECVVRETNHSKIVQKAIEARGIKVKVSQIPVPVPFSAAFEGERVRKENMYVQFGGKYSTAFEYLRMKKMDQVEDGKIEVIGPEADKMREGESYPLGIVIDVAGRKMNPDFEPILERQIHRFLNYAMGIFHMGQRDMNWVRISKDARKAGFNIRHFGDILVAKLHDEYGAIVDKVQVTIYTNQKDVEKMLPEVRKVFTARDERLAGMTDESVDTFYSCTLCQSFAPDHVCVVSPERLGLCGAYSWLDARAAHEITPTGGNQPIKKGKTIDQKKGIWEGVNRFVTDNSHQHVTNMAVYSLMDSPMTSCGCFECIVAIVPEANGVMIVNREYAGETPAGMKFTTLASSVGGGNQTPGFLGVGRLYIASKKFISAEGGIKRIVWMPKELKGALADKLKARAQEAGAPDMVDKIADETVATDAAALVAYLEKVKHPALSMEPMV